MSVTSKSPRDVLVTAYLVAQRSIKPYSHKYSRKDFTQHQLFAILVLKNFLKTDYRGVVKQLKDCDSLCEAIQLTKVPHYTTLQKASVRLLKTAPVRTLLADAGYDSESNHSFARDDHGIRSVIPARQGRPTKKPASGRYRRLMQVRFNRKAYRQRSQVETVMSMIKRRQGNHVHGRSYHSQCRDLRLMVLTHNVMILLCIKVFYRAGRS